MSDSDEDFASADEGEVDSTPAADSPKALGAVKEVATKSKAEKKDDSKSQADSAKSQNQDNIPAGKKKGKGKNEKKSEENKAPEASGGTVNAPVKEPDVKPKGKKGKNKDRGKKNANKVAEPKENKTESDKSGVVSNTQEDKIAAVKDEPVDISEAQDGTNACSDNVKVDNAATDKKGNDNEGDNGKAKSLDIDNESVKDNVDETSESKNDTNSNDASGDNKDISIDNVPASPSGKLSVEQKADLIKSPSSQSISRPQPDHTDKQEEVLDKLASSAKEKSSGGWGWGWGSSLLDVASSSVSTFTNQVGEGFNTVLETVESTLNMPNPEELAKQNTAIDNQDDDNDVSKPEKDDTKPVPKEEDKSTSLSKDGEPDKTVEDKTQTSNQSTADGESSGSSSGWFSSWGVSNITKMVESTSKNLVTGSLDVLETLGKKTFDVINEHDPGLRKARAFLHDRGDKPNLSAILRDAKDQEEVRVQHEKESEEARKAHFGSLFDDYQGLAHLEALEMLSNQCEKRVNVILNNLPAETITSIKPQLLLIKQNFEIDDDDDDDDDDVTQDFDKLVTDILHNLNVGTTPDKLIKTKQSIEDNFKQCNESADSSKIKEIHRVAISSLAEFTSKSIEQFHKAGELILIQKTKEYNYVDCSNLLRSFTKILTTETGILSTNFTECLNKMEGDDEIKVNHLVTNIFLEASNSSSYIQDGFRLLLPVIQQAAIESSQEPE